MIYTQVQALKKELDSRLSIIPMDLDAAALQREWLQIDNVSPHARDIQIITRHALLTRSHD